MLIAYSHLDVSSDELTNRQADHKAKEHNPQPVEVDHGSTADDVWTGPHPMYGLAGIV